MNTQRQIRTLCDACVSDGRFAFDTEFVMEDRYEPELCLLQVATCDRVWLVDPYLELDLSEIWALVCDRKVTTIVHAGQEDLSIAVNVTGKAPQKVYDLQVAAGLVGFDYPISLQRLIQSTRHIRLHKAKTLTDWRKRPLSESQLRYAAEDVQFLLPTWDLLYKRLRKLKRLDWADEESARLEDVALYQRVIEDRLFRIKGASGLAGKHLAIAREILTWRDAVAKRYNRPARVLLKDHLVVQIAKHEMNSFAEIRDLRGVNLKDADVRSLARAAQAGLQTPKENYPHAKPRDVETPEEATLMPFLTALLRGYCAQHDIAHSLAATQRTIRELIRYGNANGPGERAEIELLQGWRSKTVGKLLKDVLAGKIVAQVVARNGSLTIDMQPA